MRFAMKSMSLGRHRHEAPVLLPAPRCRPRGSSGRSCGERLLSDVADDDVRGSRRRKRSATRERRCERLLVEGEPVGEQVLGLVEALAPRKARCSSGGCRSSSGPATSRIPRRATRTRRSSSGSSARAGPSSCARGPSRRPRSRRTAATAGSSPTRRSRRRPSLSSWNSLWVRSRIPAIRPTSRPSRRATKSCISPCRKNGFSSGRPSSGRRAAARPSADRSVEPIRDVEEWDRSDLSGRCVDDDGGAHAACSPSRRLDRG